MSQRYHPESFLSHLRATLNLLRSALPLVTPNLLSLITLRVTPNMFRSRRSVAAEGAGAGRSKTEGSGGDGAHAAHVVPVVRRGAGRRRGVVAAAPALLPRQLQPLRRRRLVGVARRGNAAQPAQGEGDPRPVEPQPERIRLYPEGALLPSLPLNEPEKHERAVCWRMRAINHVTLKQPMRGFTSVSSWIVLI